MMRVIEKDNLMILFLLLNRISDLFSNFLSY